MNAGNDPSDLLLNVAVDVVRPWMERLVVGVVAQSSGASVDRAMLGEQAYQVIEHAAANLERQLSELLALDVEQQRANPLGLFRSATRPLTEYLRRSGYEPVTRDRFEVERFPDDVYGLAPATWDDIDAQLAPVGMAWGAWKAAAILARRRERAASTDGERDDVS